MRIISGKFRGTRLLVSEQHTRPTSDRLKESLFNACFQHCSEQMWLDLYAGCGAIGLEALSRNAKYVVFNDKNLQAYDVVAKNIEKCRVSERSKLYHMNDYEMIELLNAQKRKFDVIFLDPPYAYDIQPILDQLDKTYLVEQGTMIVIEQDKTDKEYVMDKSYEKTKEKIVGQSIYRVYRKERKAP